MSLAAITTHLTRRIKHQNNFKIFKKQLAPLATLQSVLGLRLFSHSSLPNSIYFQPSTI